MENLISFGIVIVSQLIFFVIHAISVGHKKEIFKYLKTGCFVGLPFGIIFDLIVGKYLGIFHYELGFVWWFLIINGILSYGFMIANILLLKGHSVIHMYLWSVGLGLMYEVTNWFFPVWEWSFISSVSKYVIVVFVAYSGLTWLMMLFLRIMKGIKFRLIPF